MEVTLTPDAAAELDALNEPTSEIQTVTLAGKAFVIVERSEFERLQGFGGGMVEDGDLPKLPEPDAHGNYPACPSARASLARKIIRRRKTAGLTQADLAHRAGIRPETLSRLEKGKSTPGRGHRRQNHSRVGACGSESQPVVAWPPHFAQHGWDETTAKSRMSPFRRPLLISRRFGQRSTRRRVRRR